MGSQLLDRWRRGISAILAVGGPYVNREVNSVRNVSDAIANVLSCFDALIEVLRLEKQTMLVVRLTAMAECSRGLLSLMEHALRYSLAPKIDVKKLQTTQEGLLASQRGR